MTLCGGNCVVWSSGAPMLRWNSSLCVQVRPFTVVWGEGSCGEASRCARREGPAKSAATSAAPLQPLRRHPEWEACTAECILRIYPSHRWESQSAWDRHRGSFTRLVIRATKRSNVETDHIK